MKISLWKYLSFNPPDDVFALKNPYHLNPIPNNPKRFMRAVVSEQTWVGDCIASHSESARATETEFLSSQQCEDDVDGSAY